MIQKLMPTLCVKMIMGTGAWKCSWMWNNKEAADRNGVSKLRVTIIWF